MDTNVFTKIPPELLSYILEDTTLLDLDSPLLLSLICRGKVPTWEGRLELPRVIWSEAERLSSLTLRFLTKVQPYMDILACTWMSTPCTLFSPMSTLHYWHRVLGATEELRVLDLEACISVPLSLAPLLPSSSPDLPSNDEHPVLPHLNHLTLCANNLHEALDSMILPSLHMLSIDDLDENQPETANDELLLTHLMLQACNSAGYIQAWYLP
ncbi:hypothetical protein BDQ17DRAFT_1336952 [Cyathus striatus]|nr:hypothetical protein BDQ17DRAFT_1336952 [Cyathus striatus]